MQQTIRNILAPFLDPKTYKNIAYLFTTFPLGLFYFVFFSTGLSLAFSLLVVLVGFPILLFVMAASSMAVVFERQLANSLLETDIEVNPPPTSTKLDILQKYFNQANLKGLVYLFLKFPLGIITFVFTILLVALPFGFILGPLMASGPDAAGMPPAPISIIIGLLIGSVSLPILNKIADVWRDLTVSMIGNGERRQDRAYVTVEAQSKAKRYYDPYFDPDESYQEPEIVRAARPAPEAPPARLVDQPQEAPAQPTSSLQQRIIALVEEKNQAADD